MRRTALLAMSVVLFCSCSNNEGELVDRAPVTPGAEPAVEAPAISEMPAGHPPIAQNPAMPQSALEPGPSTQVKVEGQTVTIPPITFQVAPQWQSTPPASSMRAAQFAIPPVEGDSEPAELAVFKGIGGSADQNIERWIGQIQVPNGPAPVTAEQQVGEFKVKTLSVEGAFTAAMGGPMMGGGAAMGSGSAKPGMRMLAAVVEGPGGPWHFKLVGPVKTVTANQDAFNQLIASIQSVQQ